MINRLPKWVLVGGWLLSFVAGIVNAVAILSFAEQAVSHLTATTTRLAIAATDGDWTLQFKMLSVISTFLAGAILSGWLIRSTSLEVGRRYGAALLIEAAALILAAACLGSGHFSGIALCCFACGLQNGMASTFSGAIIRTTHMTGLFTDLGVHVGQILRGCPAERNRIRLYITLISGFFCGGIAADVLFQVLAAKTLYVGALIIVAMAVGYHGLMRQFSS